MLFFASTYIENVCEGFQCRSDNLNMISRKFFNIIIDNFILGRWSAVDDVSTHELNIKHLWCGTFAHKKMLNRSIRIGRDLCIGKEWERKENSWPVRCWVWNNSTSCNCVWESKCAFATELTISFRALTEQMELTLQMVFPPPRNVARFQHRRGSSWEIRVASEGCHRRDVKLL